MVKNCLKKLHQQLGLDFREYFGIASRELLGLEDIFKVVSNNYFSLREQLCCKWYFTVKVILGNPGLRSLTLAPRKLVEMLIKSRIIKDLAENNMMETDHHGFCKRNLCLCKIFTFFVHINYWVL